MNLFKRSPESKRAKATRGFDAVVSQLGESSSIYFARTGLWVGVKEYGPDGGVTKVSVERPLRLARGVIEVIYANTGDYSTANGESVRHGTALRLLGRAADALSGLRQQQTRELADDLAIPTGPTNLG